MKIRNGFVSNSSSSSFIVESFKWFEQEKILSDEKEQKLIEYGFKPVQTYNSMDVMCTWDLKTLAPGKDDKPLSYGYNVACNQSEVIEWLVENDIPFKALCDYGHESVIFDGKNIYTIPNHGIEAEMHGVDELDWHFKHKFSFRGLIYSLSNFSFRRTLRVFFGKSRPKKSSIISKTSSEEYLQKRKRNNEQEGIFNLSC